MNDIKFDIKKFNNDMNKKIELNKKKRDDLLNEKIIELNKRNEELELMKQNNEPYIKFINELIINFKLIVIDIINFDIYKILYEDNKLLYLGIWFIIFAILLYVLSYNCDVNEKKMNVYIDGYLNNKINNKQIPIYNYQ
jgi:hypothetical protein